MTVRVYKSSDAGAPVLTGQNGSLVALLDAVLVNGYGALAAAGWTINQTAANKRGYKQNLAGSNNAAGMLLYVDDSGPGAGAAKEARVCGFETMSAITPTGTGQFPTAAQSTVGIGTLVVRKSVTADATARPWTCIANGQTIYLFIESGDTTTPLATTTFCFGDFKSFKTADQYAVMIIGRTVENTGSAINDPLHATNVTSNNLGIATLNTSMYGHFACRHWTGTGGSIHIGKPTDTSRFFSNAANSNPGAYNPLIADGTQTASIAGVVIAMGRNATNFQSPAPNGPDGALALGPVWIGHHFALRGYLAGLWAPLHDRPLGHNDNFTVVGGNLNGKSLLAQNIQAYINGVANGDNGQVVVETSDTWS
jgi:hypothetical protein